MDNLERKEIMDYLNMAIDLETEIATQEQILTETKRVWEMRKPALDLQKMPAQPMLYSTDNKHDWDNNNDSGWGALVWFIVAIATIFFMAIPLCMNGTLNWGIFSILAGIISGIIGVRTLRKPQRLNTEASKMNQEIMAEYSRKRNIINNQNAQIKIVYNEKLREWNESWTGFRQSLNEPSQQTKELLDRLYEKNIVYAKYHNLPALTSIYEYFITGRCDELTGPHGAYNMYEDEKRKDTVISQLSVVIDNLEQIKNNQYMLYQQVSSIQKTTNAVVYELQQVKGYAFTTAQLSALTAYYAGLTATNSSISTALEMWNI